MDQRNLILAIVLSLGILLTYELFIGGPQRQELLEQSETAQLEETIQQPDAEIPTPLPGETTPGAAVGDLGDAAGALSRADALALEPRIAIDSPTLSGSISLEGGRFDDLILKRYRETIEPDSPQIELLHPIGAAQPYFANFGWSAGTGGPPVPGGDSLWQANGDILGPGSPVTLTWDNGQGLRFERSLALDENYMFTVTQRVLNDGDTDVQLSPYGLISRTGTPEILGFYILHEGLIGVLNDTLEEIDYSDLVDDGPDQFETTSGWLGITRSRRASCTPHRTARTSTSRTTSTRP
jgi:YidC/Oxa1 family membrane protein insertase